MNMPEKMELQRKEFNAANAFAKALGQHNRTPIVDDDYPEVRRQYEGALAGLIEAMRANGRFEVGNRYGLSAPASPQGVSWEAWAKEFNFDLTMDGPVYASPETNIACSAFHAGASLTAAGAAPEGWVWVPRDALLTEAKRLRYREGEAYGFGPSTTDAGAQMRATAEKLEVLAATPNPGAQHGQEGRE